MDLSQTFINAKIYLQEENLHWPDQSKITITRN